MDPELDIDLDEVDDDDFDIDSFDWKSALDEDDTSTESADDDEGDDESEGDEPDEDDDDESDEVEGDEPEAEEVPQHFTVKVNGEEFDVTLDELRSGYMRHADYTRKTQDLAADREAAQAYRALEQALARDPEAALVALRTQLGLDDADTQELDPLEREVKELRQWQATQLERDRQAAVERELSAVQQRYGIADDTWTEDAQDELLKYAIDHNIPDLDIAYRAMTYEAKKVAEEAADEAERQRQAKVAAKRRAPKVASGAKRSAAPRTKGASEMLSIEDAFAEAIRELS